MSRGPVLRLIVVGFVGALSSGLAGCPSRDAPSGREGEGEVHPDLYPEGVQVMTIELTSTVFENGGPIPTKYTGEGHNVSPPLAWSNVPEGTKELALICDDPDAPTTEPWVHWVIYKIPVETTSLPEGVKPKLHLSQPSGALQGKNSWPKSDPPTIGYRGPMPPKGHGEHRYFFKLYALEVKLVTQAGASKKELLQDMAGHVIGEGQLMGTYQRL